MANHEKKNVISAIHPDGRYRSIPPYQSPPTMAAGDKPLQLGRHYCSLGSQRDKNVVSLVMEERNGEYVVNQGILLSLSSNKALMIRDRFANCWVEWQYADG